MEETESGTKRYTERKLGGLVDACTTGDVLVVAELSRLGRSLYEIMELLNILMLKNVKVYTVKENIQLDETISAKVMAFAFGLSAEIERQLISQRTKEGLQRVRLEGKTL